jgi:Mg/Co/Ni transporter MgtE
MTRSVLRAGHEETVGALRRRIAAEQPELADPILAVDGAGRYRGVIRLDRLIASDEARIAHELADARWPSVLVSTDQEHVAELARAKALVAVPSSPSGRALGCIGDPAARRAVAGAHGHHRLPAS